MIKNDQKKKSTTFFLMKNFNNVLVVLFLDIFPSKNNKINVNRFIWHALYNIVNVM